MLLASQYPDWVHTPMYMMAEKVPTRADQGQKVAHLLIVGFSMQASLIVYALYSSMADYGEETRSLEKVITGVNACKQPLRCCTRK